MKKSYILAGLFSVMLCAGAILLSQVGQRGQGTPVAFKQISAVSSSVAWAIGTDGAVYRWDYTIEKWKKTPKPMR